MKMGQGREGKKGIGATHLSAAAVWTCLLALVPPEPTVGCLASEAAPAPEAGSDSRGALWALE